MPSLNRKKKEEKPVQIPSLELLSEELKREKSKNSRSQMIKNISISLLAVAAATVLLAMLILPVFQITGTSMTNTLQDGDIVVGVKGISYQPGDIIAFYHNNDILVKRVVAVAGDWIDIDSDGNVYINDELLDDERFVIERSLGDCNITLPYQVPADRYFVLGDRRATSIDSRNTAVGCVSTDMVMGKIVLRVWPLKTVKLVT